MEEQQMSKDEIIRAIDALNRLVCTYVNNKKEAEPIYTKIDNLISKL